MKLMPIVYVTDMDRSVSFYRSLVPDASVISQSAHWTEMDVEGASLALHLADEVRADRLWVELAFVAHSPLESVLEHLSTAGISPERGIADEAFGRSVLVRDPDGLPIQINEHEDELYPS